MGINSTGVSYDFGQMGVAFISGTGSFNPPAGMVIVAITSVNATAAEFDDSGGLISELDANGNSPWLTTEADAHGVGVINDTLKGHNNSDTSNNITLNGSNSNIKVGMILQSALLFPRSLTNPYVVKSISGTTLVAAKKLTPTITAPAAAAVASGGGGEDIFFLENGGGQGVGGVKINDSAAKLSLAEGTTIYGRWTGGKLSAGQVIIYFGF